MTKAIRRSMLARRPAPANPIAVEPKEAIDRNELAAASSSSLASSGIKLSWAGSKNCLTPALSRSSAYRPTIAIDSTLSTSAMDPTITAWIRQVQMRMRLRSWRSTKTPASRPTTRLGMAVTIKVRPTARAELVTRNTKIAAARSVSAEPAVEISWASQSSEKSRLRKTANIDGAGTDAAVMRPPGAPRRHPIPRACGPRPGPVTWRRWAGV